MLNKSSVINSSLLILVLSLFSVAQADLLVLSDRPQARFQEAIDEIESRSGEKVEYVELAAEKIVERLENDPNEKVDLIIVKDLVNLAQLKAGGHLQSFSDRQNFARVSPSMQDPDFQWLAISFRVRSVVYDPSRVSAEELTTYEDLASEKWQGRLCLRSSAAAYNQALAGHLVESYGAETAKGIFAGWVNNLAVPVMRNDTAVLGAITEGTCDVGISNHYYLAGEIAKNPNFPVKMAFLDQDRGGVHTNGTGIGLSSRSPNTALAEQFASLLFTDANQLKISSAHFDFPAVLSLQPSTFINDWGTFQKSINNWDKVGTRINEAKALMLEAGYN